MTTQRKAHRTLILEWDGAGETDKDAEREVYISLLDNGIHFGSSYAMKRNKAEFRPHEEEKTYKALTVGENVVEVDTWKGDILDEFGDILALLGIEHTVDTVSRMEETDGRVAYGAYSSAWCDWEVVLGIVKDSDSCEFAMATAMGVMFEDSTNTKLTLENGAEVRFSSLDLTKRVMKISVWGDKDNLSDDLTDSVVTHLVRAVQIAVDEHGWGIPTVDCKAVFNATRSEACDSSFVSKMLNNGD